MPKVRTTKCRSGGIVPSSGTPDLTHFVGAKDPDDVAFPPLLLTSLSLNHHLARPQALQRPTIVCERLSYRPSAVHDFPLAMGVSKSVAGFHKGACRKKLPQLPSWRKR